MARYKMQLPRYFTLSGLQHSIINVAMKEHTLAGTGCIMRSRCVSCEPEHTWARCEWCARDAIELTAHVCRHRWHALSVHHNRPQQRASRLDSTSIPGPAAGACHAHEESSVGSWVTMVLEWWARGRQCFLDERAIRLF